MDKIQELFKKAKDKALEAKALLEADEPDMEQANALLADAEKGREQAKHVEQSGFAGPRRSNQRNGFTAIKR